MNLFSLIREDISIRSEKSLIKAILVFWFNISLRLILNYRIGHFLSYNRNFLFNIIILYLKKRQHRRYGCDISFQAKIGRRIRFPHPIGIVIGTDVVIEDDVTIWQHVTLGSTGRDKKMAYPTIKSNVKIFSNAQIFGDVTIGFNAKIGAFALVLREVPEGKVAVGIPARIIE